MEICFSENGMFQKDLIKAGSFCIKNGVSRTFPGGPMVKNLPSNARDMSLIPGQGTQIPHATRPKLLN